MTAFVFNRTAQVWFGLLMLTCAQSLAFAGAAAAHIAGGVPNAHLAGEGSYRWFGLKIYDAQLWVDEKNMHAEMPGAARFSLDLRYARDLQGAKIAAASIDEIKKLGIGSPAQHSAWLGKMALLFPDVKDGNRITGVYLPGQGARFYLDGKLLGEIRDAEFGRAFFAIWLDPKTSAKNLREALLGGMAAR